MAEIQVGIEGENAPAAAEALLEIPGISGSYEVPSQKEATLAAVATIVGIVGGAAAWSSGLIQWCYLCAGLRKKRQGFLWKHDNCEYCLWQPTRKTWNQS